jgi:threonine dehydrogenase-like Zn-dependent dehydrogenase
MTQSDRSALAAIMPGPSAPGARGGDCELREISLPELEPDSALLRVEFSEVCGTDVYLRDGRLAGVPYPIIPGHVSVGVLEKIRGKFLDIDGKPFVEGDRVTFLDVHKTCNACWSCLVAKASTRCPSRKVYGITYGLEDGLTGGWSQSIYLKPGVRAIRMDDVPSETFIAGGCSLPTAMHAVERADISFADTVLVLGSGPVGLSAIAFSSLRGAGKILCIGAPDGRLEVASAMGADAVLNFEGQSEDQRRDWVFEKTAGRGADVTIECSGAPVAVTQAMRMTRDAGRVVVVGQYTDHGEVAFNPHLDLNKKHLDIRGCWGSDYSHFHRVVEMLRVERVAKLWSHVSVERYPLSGVNDALAAVEVGEVVKALVVPEA